MSACAFQLSTSVAPSLPSPTTHIVPHAGVRICFAEERAASFVGPNNTPCLCIVHSSQSHHPHTLLALAQSNLSASASPSASVPPPMKRRLVSRFSKTDPILFLPGLFRLRLVSFLSLRTPHFAYIPSWREKERKKERKGECISSLQANFKSRASAMSLPLVPLNCTLSPIPSLPDLPRANASRLAPTTAKSTLGIYGRAAERLACGYL